jgi:hypothetical protein
VCECFVFVFFCYVFMSIVLYTGRLHTLTRWWRKVIGYLDANLYKGKERVNNFFFFFFFESIKRSEHIYETEVSVG